MKKIVPTLKTSHRSHLNALCFSCCPSTQHGTTKRQDFIINIARFWTFHFILTTNEIKAMNFDSYLKNKQPLYIAGIGRKVIIFQIVRLTNYSPDIDSLQPKYASFIRWLIALNTDWNMIF